MVLTALTIIGAIITAAGGWAQSLDAMGAGALVTTIGLLGSGYLLDKESAAVRVIIFIFAIITYFWTVALSIGAGIAPGF